MIEVIEPGPLTSVQDPFGRPGWRRYGVPVGGAADAWSARLANRLAGNDDAAAVLEVTLGGCVLQAMSGVVVAVTGGLVAGLDGVRLPGATARPMRTGQVLRLDPGEGSRGYVAFGGGVVVPSVLGSTSTDLRAGFGGHDGRSLRAGDRLVIGPSPARSARWTGRPVSGPIRVVPGPSDGLERLVHAAWTVGAHADRAGVRLDGAVAEIGGEVATMGLPLGAIQVPPDGRPIVMLVDRPVTGGYRVPACVIGADIGRVAQLLPGDEVRLAPVSMREARAAWQESEAALGVELFDAELGWVGAHA